MHPGHPRGLLPAGWLPGLQRKLQQQCAVGVGGQQGSTTCSSALATECSCELPAGASISSHLLHVVDGFLWLDGSQLTGNVFAHGSLVEATNHTAVVMQKCNVSTNVMMTGVNVTAHTLFRNITAYRDLRWGRQAPGVGREAEAHAACFG